jgi:hypothetical protein
MVIEIQFGSPGEGGDNIISMGMPLSARRDMSKFLNALTTRAHAPHQT